MNQKDVNEPPENRGISPANRSQRLGLNATRAEAIAKGRRRLARVSENLNAGFRSLPTLRLAVGLSQAELSTKLEMTQAELARLEKGTGKLSLPSPQKLAQVLGVDISEVIAAVEGAKSTGDERASLESTPPS